ncbi:MAG: alkaline phosphatase, partial [Pseudomonadota bacterium]
MRSSKAPATRRLTALVLSLPLALSLVLGLFSPGLAATPPAKNVILLIPDGCSAEQYTLARWAKGQPLAQDAILAGGVRTYIADSVVADSAPAATAYATGLRTADKLIGLAPPDQGMLPGQASPAGQAYRPLATVLEAARLSGRSTGLVATSRITHATPAGFAAHVSHRNQEDAVAKQMAHQGLTVFLGGGLDHFLPQEKGGKRPDGLDLWAELGQRGYKTVQNRKDLLEFKAVRGGKLAGLFASSHLKADRERAELAPEEPSLAEMTAKALEVLSQNPKGFFLMVEGSQIDWACHANDPGHLVGDLLAYDQAVAVALDFARKNPRTLLIAVSDHNTGGMSIGNYATSKTYSQMKPEALLAPLSKMKVTAKTLWDGLGKDISPERLQEAVGRLWGMEIGPEEAQRILAVAAKRPKSPEDGLGEVLSAKHTLVGWATHGHSGGDVPLFAYGPGHPTGLLEAPQVGLTMAKALGANLRQLDQRLHAPAAQALAGLPRAEEKTAQGWRLKVRTARGEIILEDGGDTLELAGRRMQLEAPVLRVEETGQW